MIASSKLNALVVVIGVAIGATAFADRYEATLTVRPEGTVARVDDSGARSPSDVPGGGLAAGLSWGVRNWLDIGGEVAGFALSEASYEDATADVFGVQHMGRLTRTSRLAQARALATLRLGVAWVPTVQLAVGAGMRQRSAAQLAFQGDVVTPDGEKAAYTVDAVVGIRVGLDHRITRRWSIGLSVGATTCIGIDAPGLQLFDAGLGVAYTWYPLW